MKTKRWSIIHQLLLLNLWIVGPSSGQGLDGKHAIKPTVIVNIGKPQAWTMEQAHYLLERNRARDLGIAAKDLGDLDANEIVGYRLDALKTLLSAQVQFDQVKGKQNSATLSKYQTEVSRYNALIQRHDQLAARQTEAAVQQAAAEYQLEVLKAQSPPDQQKVQIQTAEVARLKANKAAIDAEATSVTTAITTAPTLGNLTSTIPADDTNAASILKGIPLFDSYLKDLPKGLNDSKLQASIRLDNYINLQYEIVAKQLTLLRDQAGPDKRVVFVELPHSVYVTQKFKPYPDLPALWGSHLVQAWWRIDGAKTAKCDESDKLGEREFKRPPTAQELFEAASINTTAKNGTPSVHTVCGYKSEDFRRKNGAFYALDLIPRRSALNVAEAHSVSRAYGFAGIFSLLSGLGGKARYERQRDQYDQFAQQEAYASAFGKGDETFGWTFGPLPGTKRMDPGLRTTYAVLVVPKDTRVIQLSGVGCGYRRRVVPRNPFTDETDETKESGEREKAKPGLVPKIGEDCGAIVHYDVEVPSGDDNFRVNKAYYHPVVAGRRITLELEGLFSDLIGILINGTPLQKVVSIGQPMLQPGSFTVPANAGDSAVQGVFEVVGRKQIIASFSMPATFTGTPQIAIVTAMREAVINYYTMQIHDGVPGGKTLAQSADMFYSAPAINRVAPIYRSEDQTVAVSLFGQGLRIGAPRTLLLNGDVLSEEDRARPCTKAPDRSGTYCILNSGVILARFSRTDYFPHWHFSLLVHNSEQPVDAAINYDDDGPPIIASKGACTLTEIKEDDVVTRIDMTMAGEYFTAGYTPVASNKQITVSTTVLVSPKKWTISATVPKAGDWRNASLLFKSTPPATDNPQFGLRSCSVEP